jgi:Lrp/AsnC family leucine-responsive transcriptional regulator
LQQFCENLETMQKFDEKDLRILDALQRDATTPAEVLGADIGLSATSVQRRTKRLQADKVILRQTCQLSPEKLGFGMRCIVGVELDVEQADVLAQFRALLAAEPRVQQSYYVTGASDFVLFLLVRDMQDFEALTQRLFFGNRFVRRFTTSVVMSVHKDGADVPVLSAATGI